MFAFLLIMTAILFVNNGASSSINSMGLCAVVAFHPSQQHHGGNHNHNQNKNNGNENGRQQNYPEKSKTIEPRSTEFPKTSTPEDGNNGKSGMFSPMNGNDDRNNDQRKRKKRRQAQKVVKSIWDTSAPILVEASSLQTIDFEEPSVERVQVLLKKSDMNPISGKRTTTREPLIARVDLWHGPDSTPQNLAIYLEDDEDDEEMQYPYDGEDYDECQFAGESDRAKSYSCDTPFSTIIETPHGHNTIAIRNIAESCDLLTCVEGEKNEDYWYKPSSPPASNNHSPLQSVVERLKATTTPQRIDSTTARKSSETHGDCDDDEESKAVVGSCTVELPSKVASVQVLLQTDYMQPIQARIELELRMTDVDNPNYRVVKRTIVEVYSEDGMHRPFFAVLETPRKSNRKTRLRRNKGKGGNAEQGWFSSNSSSNASYSTSMKVVNLSTTEFPLFATVEPHAIDDSIEDDEHKNDSPSPQRPESEEDDTTRQEWTHFGGGSNFNMNSNSTILDAEIL